MEKKVYIDLPPFTGRNVPIKEIAQAIGKDPHYIRLAIQQGIFKFGVAMKVGNSTSSVTTVRIVRCGKKPDISGM